MSVFNINGQETDSMAEAQEILRQVWSEYKAPAVREQHIAALSKMSDLDRRRAEFGITVGAGGASVVAPNSTGSAN